MHAQNKKLCKVYIFGYAAGPGKDTCKLSTNAKYGFKIVPLGCSPRKRLLKKNKKTLLRLDKLNGKEWREKYKTEYSQCNDQDIDTIWFEN